ncbi:pectinesterase inhibitor-like [Cucurbita pepo subsp. pepo]|uniref:pectinesterase inhibitor-like n=1 Tax=Cucurbita pepo subsp. pepo TaxID=3664 RepID=UPI000C9D4E02|nr:pectinesterase inhibitor-like [Cucurbita pepo subsp. pepo]
MASSSFLAVSSLLAFVLSLLFFNGVVPMHAASSDDVASSICKKTKNPSICFNVLKSAGTTDLKGLATFTLNLAHEKTTGNRALAQSLASKVADPDLKEHYDTCVERYNDAVKDIEGAKGYLGKGDYKGLNTYTFGAMTEVDACLFSLSKLPKDPSTLPGNGKAVEDIYSIILVIANLLLEHA